MADRLYTNREIEEWVRTVRERRHLSFMAICRAVECDKRNLLKRLRNQKPYPLWLRQAFTLLMNDYYAAERAAQRPGRPVPLAVDFKNGLPRLQLGARG